MGGLTFITNHGAVLAFIAKHPRSTTRVIGDAVHITERAAHKIIKDLVEGGYLDRKKEGRRNHYLVNADMPLRHATLEDVALGDFLKVMVGRKRQRRRVKEAIS